MYDVVTVARCMQTSSRTEVIPQNAFAHDTHAYSGVGGERGGADERPSVLKRMTLASDGVRMKPLHCTACGGIGHISDVCPSVNAF
jgi:hypothetical protein